jgi:hypothetical protein
MASIGVAIDGFFIIPTTFIKLIITASTIIINFFSIGVHVFLFPIALCFLV